MGSTSTIQGLHDLARLVEIIRVVDGHRHFQRTFLVGHQAGIQGEITARVERAYQRGVVEYIRVAGGDGHVAQDRGLAPQVGHLQRQNALAVGEEGIGRAVEIDLQLRQGVDQQGDRLVVDQPRAAGSIINKRQLEGVGSRVGGGVDDELRTGFVDRVDLDIPEEDHVGAAQRGEGGQIRPGGAHPARGGRAGRIRRGTAAEHHGYRARG